MKRESTPLEFIGLLLLLPPLCITIIWWSNFRGYFMNPSSFTKTGGVVTQSYVTWHGGKGTGYNYHITYEYSVAGQRYTSKQVTFGAWGRSDASFAEGYTQKYPVGRPVTVWYKPDEPSFAVLEPRSKQSTLSVLLFTAALYVLAFGFIVRGVIKRRKRV